MNLLNIGISSQLLLINDPINNNQKKKHKQNVFQSVRLITDPD